MKLFSSTPAFRVSSWCGFSFAAKRKLQARGACSAGAVFLAALMGVAPVCVAQVYQQTNLVSDLPGLAEHTDPNLVNPWGIAASATSPFWVADNGTGLSTLYNSSGTPQELVVTVPPFAGGTEASPTGIVFNGSPSFEVTPGTPARFIFATEEGTIAAWASGTTALLKVDNNAAGAIYKGLAIGNNGSGDFLYAANFHAGTIDVFDANFAAVTLAGNFTDPTLPAGYAPFNIQNIGDVLYVTYALQDANAEDDVPGAGHGFIDKFDLDGNFLGRFVSQGELNSPWGLALAPAGFGPFAGDLLVGNFGDGRINAFDPATGDFLGQLNDASGSPIAIEGLWGLRFGNGGNGGTPGTLYFTAGIAGPGQVEDHGLFGSIGFNPAERQLVNISTRALVGAGEKVAIAGFIVRSDLVAALSSKRVLIRGIGPSLATGGTPVPGRLMDTVLELHDSNGQIIAVNDDWRDTDAAAIQATGLAPSDNHESAIVAMLGTDATYTAVLRGKNDTGGIALVEVYDLEPTTETHLANLSGRAFVSTGDNVLIGGVIVSGDSDEQFLLRAIGPSLAARGVSGPLQDPVLELYDNQGNLIERNDNWAEDEDGTPNPARAAEITATGIAPEAPAEAAILASPAPGNFTFIVRGKNDGTGVALAEAFRLGPQAGAVYAMTNQVPNAIAVFDRAPDGTLTARDTVPTGGDGDPVAEPQDPPIDPLASQNSLILSENRRFLFAVNAGSNEISVLEVTPGALTRARLTFVGKVPSGGTRPISLTQHGNLLYVLNEDGTPNITGFTIGNDGMLTPIAGSTQPLSGGATVDPAEVAFSPDGRVLVVTEKNTNTIDTFAVSDEGVASAPVTTPSAGVTPFGFAFDNQANLIVSEAAAVAPGQATVSSYRVPDNGPLDVVSPAVPNMQTASCWLAIPRNGRFAYTTNSISGTISSYQIATGGGLSLLSSIAADSGMTSGPIDMALDGSSRFLYVHAAGLQMIEVYQVHPDGSLTSVSSIGGLPMGAQGIVAR